MKNSAANIPIYRTFPNWWTPMTSPNSNNILVTSSNYQVSVLSFRKAEQQNQNLSLSKSQMFFIFFSSNTAPPASGTTTKNSSTIIQNRKSAKLAISLLNLSSISPRTREQQHQITKAPKKPNTQIDSSPHDPLI
jgi:hypothetical protein